MLYMGYEPILSYSYPRKYLDKLAERPQQRIAVGLRSDKQAEIDAEKSFLCGPVGQVQKDQYERK